MASLSKKRIFVDADAFVALAKSDDQNHARATKALDRLVAQGAHFLTSNYVFAEAVTVLSLRVSHQTAVEFMQMLRDPQGGIQILWVNEEIELKAMAIFQEQRSKNVSFMDCCHMSCVDAHRLDAIFSFDHIYVQNKIPVVN